MKESVKDIEKVWEIIKNEPTIWNCLEINNQSFYFNYKHKKLFLSSFQAAKLPEPPYKTKFLGKFLTKTSHFANIMSRRPGTEEVTFYALLNSPQGGILGRSMDKKMLNIAAPPLTWRREKVREEIRNKVESYTKQRQTFLFIDIGCGAGFDSLEVERIMHRLENLTEKQQWLISHACLNIDIDTTWLNNNQMLAEELYGCDCNIMRENVSAFDFLSKGTYHSLLKQYDNLIISCNGFAEFLPDEDLIKLYQGIRNLTDEFVGKVYIILPFANKNEQQEAIGNKIGFQFRAKDKNKIVEIIKEIFEHYNVSYTEEYSQILLTVER
ncbi:hypothetical protein [Enterococcus lactis]|uniref:hypothetical protein n=1 Tax=Enterococcus lactis TaxID=357441 RepID=UPI001BCF3A22|nr:hypothetical protein [Enterococcus lactis]EME8127436.1 hypothetical protein [Enterococcus faecium]